MRLRNIVRSIACCVMLAASLVVFPNAWAGGFYLDVAVASGVGATKGYVLTVRPFGCHNPSEAEITAAAEGLVAGKRQSIQLKLTRTGLDMYAIRQEWPSEGVWLLAIRGTYNSAICTALVQLGPKGKVTVEGADRRLPIRFTNRELAKEEIESALRAMTAKSGSATGASKATS